MRTVDTPIIGDIATICTTNSHSDLASTVTNVSQELALYPQARNSFKRLLEQWTRFETYYQQTTTMFKHKVVPLLRTSIKCQINTWLLVGFINVLVGMVLTLSNVCIEVYICDGSSLHRSSALWFDCFQTCGWSAVTSSELSLVESVPILRLQIPCIRWLANW